MNSTAKLSQVKITFMSGSNHLLHVFKASTKSQEETFSIEIMVHSKL